VLPYLLLNATIRGNFLDNYPNGADEGKPFLSTAINYLGHRYSILK